VEHKNPGLLEQLRFRALKLVYDVLSVFMQRDKSWQQPLFASLDPKPGTRILTFGPGSASIAIALALQFPGVSVIGADPNPKSVTKAQQRTPRRRIPNVSIVEGPLQRRLPFGAGTFDQVISLLSFHDLPPDGKIGLAKEALRVLRKGGALLVADYDKPAASGEATVLRLANYISGPAATESHIDGRWIQFIARVGFTDVQRRSSQSIRIGRISVIRARKQPSR